MKLLSNAVPTVEYTGYICGIKCEDDEWRQGKDLKLDQVVNSVEESTCICDRGSNRRLETISH
jgi:hypothetical protein